ncbi:MAG: sigma-70 family RNA polymerase sigma factor [Nodosilinea sp.]
MTQHNQPHNPEVNINSEQEFMEGQDISAQDQSLDTNAEICPSNIEPSSNLMEAPIVMDAKAAELSRKFTDEHIARQFAKFNETFEEIVSKESSSARSIFPFIRGRLYQYRLHQLYDEVAILQEVYTRTVDKILQGREITNHYAWIRSVSLRYIRELSRKHSRNTNVDESFLELLAPTEEINEEFLTDEMLKIRKAFQELSSEEQLLLSFKTVQDLSWDEIQKIWVARGYGTLSITALRKRKERAISHLRTIYHSM